MQTLTVRSVEENVQPPGGNNYRAEFDGIAAPIPRAGATHATGFIVGV